MIGGTVSRGEASLHPDYQSGYLVLSFSGWQDHAVSDGTGLTKSDPCMPHSSLALGALDMPGFTACMSFLDIGEPEAGETVVVAAAIGAAGSVAGQIAKIKGYRVAGIADGAKKCRSVVEVLGFDAAFLLLNPAARIPVCGLIVHYNETELPEGPDRLGLLTRTLLIKRIKVQGFIIFDDYGHLYDEFYDQLSPWVNQDKIIFREDTVGGLENAPHAFIGLLEGKNFGKLIIRVAKD